MAGLATNQPPSYEWQQLGTTTLSERQHSSVAYDEAISQLIVFGGDNTVNVVNDTWAFDGSRWNRLTGEVEDVRPRGEYRYLRTAPLLFSEVDPHTLYLGAQMVLKTVDGGRNWQTARLEAPVLPKALTRFNIDWTWSGAPAVLQSRAIDETGYVQPSKNDLRKIRGVNSIYHNNGIQTWLVKQDGEVENVEVS